jgi:hypothetical protein
VNNYVFLIKKVSAKVYISENGRRSLTRQTAIIRSLKHHLRKAGLLNLNYDKSYDYWRNVYLFPKDSRKLTRAEDGDYYIDLRQKKLCLKVKDNDSGESNWKEIVDLTQLFLQIKIESTTDWVYASENGRRYFSRKTALIKSVRRRLFLAIESEINLNLLPKELQIFTKKKMNPYSEKVLDTCLQWFNEKAKDKDLVVVKSLLNLR